MARKHYGRRNAAARGHLKVGLSETDPLLIRTSGRDRLQRQRAEVHRLIDLLPDKEKQSSNCVPIRLEATPKSAACFLHLAQTPCEAP